jgi:hypothetical protein
MISGWRLSCLSSSKFKTYSRLSGAMSGRADRPGVRNVFTNRKIDVFPRELFCGNPAHETMMRYPSTHAMLKASLPVSRQGRYSACACIASMLNARPEPRNLAK